MADATSAESRLSVAEQEDEVCSRRCTGKQRAHMTDQLDRGDRFVDERDEPAYRSLVEGLPAVVYVSDPDRDDTRYVSPWLESLTGQSPQDWTGERGGWRRAIHPDDRDGVLSLLASSAQRGEPFAAEYRIVRTDGRAR